MEARSKSQRWTYERFARLPSTEDDGRRREIIAGELVVSAAPRSAHQWILTRISAKLYEFVERHELGWVILGPIDVLFDEGDYLEPDLVFVRKDRRDIISERGIEAAPDLVVEILSPSTAARDRGIKRERYALYNVPEYWVVDIPNKCVEVYRPDDDPNAIEPATETMRWRPVPGGPELKIAVPELFPNM